MIFGSVSIDKEQGAVHTHRDTYMLETLTVVSVRRPLLPFALAAACGLSGFAITFSDLLYQHEVVTVAACGAASLFLGWQLGQLKLLSRDLRGSELVGAIWGRASRLHGIRREISDAVATSRKARR